MAKCLDRLRAKRRLATLENRKKIVNDRKFQKIVDSVMSNEKDIKEYISGNIGLIGKFVGNGVKEYTAKIKGTPSKKDAEVLKSMIENALTALEYEREEPVSFSELRADENRASSRTKARRKLYSVDKFKFSETVGNRLPNMGTRIPRKLKKQIKTITRKQYESVLAA